MKKLLICFLILFITITGKTQTVELPSISSDRGSMSTCPDIIIPHSLEVETGFYFKKITIENIEQGTSLYNYNFLFRHDISPDAEIRLQTDYAGIKEDSIKYSGFDPITIGTKINFFKGGKFLPKTSFLFNLTLPYFGENHFKPSNLAPAFYLLMQNNLSEQFSLCYNLGMELDGESTEPSEFLSICIEYSINKFSCYMENFNYVSSYSQPENSVDAGIAYCIIKNLQFDISGGINLANWKNNYFGNVGVSWRLPK